MDADARNHAPHRGGGDNAAHRLADQGNREAKALFSSGYHNADGTLAARFRDEPWNPRRGLEHELDAQSHR